MACLQRFVVPTSSPWGPGEGELLSLHLLEEIPRTRRQIKKGQQLEWTLRDTGTLLLFESAWRMNPGLADVCCPACRRDGTLAIDFVPGQSCPACHTGTLQCER